MSSKRRSSVELDEQPIKRTKWNTRACIYHGCPKSAAYALVGAIIATHCAEHGKPIGCVDIKHRRCQYSGCNRHPNFGIDGTNIAITCREHARMDFVDVKNKKCEFANCKRQPSFGLYGLNIATTCKRHARINFVDVKYRRCKHGIRPDVCTEESCGLISSTHKCRTCMSKQVHRTPNDPDSHLCAGCRIAYGGIARVKKFELRMSALLDKHQLYHSLTNKKLPCAPTTRYPDYVFVPSVTDHIVILEVDENEHKAYVPQCEISRISELSDSVNAKNLHMIRYNPHCKDITDDMLINAIKNALKTNYAQYNDTGVVVQYIGYSNDRIIALDQLTCDMQNYIQK